MFMSGWYGGEAREGADEGTAGKEDRREGWRDGGWEGERYIGGIREMGGRGGGGGREGWFEVKEV